jgi:hypothetical protein
MAMVVAPAKGDERRSVLVSVALAADVRFGLVPVEEKSIEQRREC